MASRIEDNFVDRRSDARSIGVLALGKVVSGGREHICLVRDISANGMKIELPDPPAVNSYVIVEMLGLNPCPARVIWQEDIHAGLAFSVAQDLDRMCKRGQDADGRAARGPRFSIGRDAKLRLAGRSVSLQVANISVGGARLRGVTAIEPNVPAQLVLRNSSTPLQGYVRWVADGDAGFSFTPALAIRTLWDAVRPR
jgi:hypothetical protein